MERRTSEPLIRRRGGVRYLQMGAWLRRVPDEYLEVGPKLAAMDRCGIERTALSINDPGPEWFGPDGPAVARIAALPAPDDDPVGGRLLGVRRQVATEFETVDDELGL